MKTLASLLLALLCLIAEEAIATVRRVPSQYPTIQAAINAASNGDTVLVAEGRYYENIVLTKKILVGSAFVLDDDTSHISRTIIDGSQPRTLDSAAVVTIDGNTDTTTVLAGFTITGGKGNWRHVNWPPVVYDMRLGTGVDVAGGGAHIHHNIIRANNVNDPNNALGGIVNIFDVSDKNGVSYVVVDHNTVSDNVLVGKDCEGGAFVVIHDASIYANIIERNIATGVSEDGYGAAFIIQNGTVKVDGNLIVGNAASHYGGAFIIYSVDIVGAVPHVTLTNNIVASNSAGRNGGGMYVAGSDVVVAVINNTFVSNTAAISGSGITIDTATVRGLNTILWDPGHPEIDVWNNGNLFASYCDIRGGYAGTGNINADPGFFTSRPDSLCWFHGTSPCANAGTASVSVGGAILAAPSVDFYGHFRPFGAAVDIGAFEDGPWSGIEDMEGYLLKEYLLYQNYPNPFNPTTVVSYQLPAVSDVRLVVYDLLGREVAVLVHERKAPGRYEAKFDATGLASGVYLCRLTAGSFVQARKMVVVK